MSLDSDERVGMNDFDFSTTRYARQRYLESIAETAKDSQSEEDANS